MPNPLKSPGFDNVCGWSPPPLLIGQYSSALVLKLTAIKALVNRSPDAVCTVVPGRLVVGAAALQPTEITAAASRTMNRTDDDIAVLQKTKRLRRLSHAKSPGSSCRRFG